MNEQELATLRAYAQSLDPGDQHGLKRRVERAAAIFAAAPGIESECQKMLRRSRRRLRYEGREL